MSQLRCTFQVVPSHSAIIPGYISIGIRGNHIDMTKFEHLDDPGFVQITGELRRWMNATSTASAPGTKMLDLIGQVGQEHRTERM